MQASGLETVSTSQYVLVFLADLNDKYGNTLRIGLLRNCTYKNTDKFQLKKKTCCHVSGIDLN